MQQTGQDIKTYNGLSFKKLYTQKQCTEIISKISTEINSYYSKFQQPLQLVAVCLLKGAFMFYTDLCKQLNMKIICQFVKISSYQGEQSKGEITIQGGFHPQNFKGKHVLVVEDMADTGLTIKLFKKILEQAQPKSLKIAVLVNRPDKKKDFQIDWIGLQCNDFIIGYGLDYNQFGRTFPAIYQKI